MLRWTASTPCIRLGVSARGVGRALTCRPGSDPTGRSLKNDLAFTRDEAVGLMADLLTSKEVPTGTTRLSGWLADNGTASGESMYPSCGVISVQSWSMLPCPPLCIA